MVDLAPSGGPCYRQPELMETRASSTLQVPWGTDRVFSCKEPLVTAPVRISGLHVSLQIHGCHQTCGFNQGILYLLTAGHYLTSWNILALPILWMFPPTASWLLVLCCLCKSLLTATGLHRHPSHHLPCHGALILWDVTRGKGPSCFVPGI